MDIAKYLNANESADLAWMKMSSDGPGNNLFAHEWPDTPTEAVRITNYEGKAPEETFGNPVWKRNPRVQITFRGTRIDVVLKRAEAVFKFLSGVKDQTINGTKYSRIKPVGEPFEIGPDTSDREQVTLNVEVSFHDSL
jgi:hypothetical protein